MNKEKQVKHWYYKDLGWLGAYVVEINGECTKQVDVSHIKEYIEELLQEKQQLKEKVNQLETNRDEAIDYIKIYTNDYTEKLEMIEILYLLEILERGKE